MNSHSTIPRSREVEYVHSRVKTTKQEIEQLKNELEKLLNSATKPTQPSIDNEKKAPEIRKVTNGKHAEVHPVKKPVPVTQKKTEPPKTSPSKKVRTYNVDEARDYIKRQKEKRAEHLKSQINVADNKLDLKKQKLRELHEKTLELVTKNVQLKRERSKSRDNEPPMRLDKSATHKKVPERVLKATTRANIQSKSQERNKPPVAPKDRSQDRCQARESPKSKIATQTTDRVSRSRSRDKQTAPPAQKSDPNFLCPPKKFPPIGAQIELEKTYLPDLDETRPDHAVDPVDLNKRILSEPNLTLRDEVDRVPVLEKKHRSRRPKKLLEHSIMTDACVKDTKETQTSRENHFQGVPWMQPPPSLPYPYNFINTVKRKLELAINSPSVVDVGVQMSERCEKTPLVERASSRQEIKEMLIRSAQSEVRSFASHKRPNLDLRVVENLELVPNKSHNDKGECNHQSPVSKNLFTNYDSESDTSKNIPEISSESVGSVSSKPRLSLDKLKDLKLQKLSESLSDGNIKTDTNGYPEKEQVSYSSDFQKESIVSVGSTGKSENSTIRTILSEKNLLNLAILSDSVVDESSTKHGVSKQAKNPDKESISEHPELQSFTRFINTNLRGEDSYQPTFRSLLTESQIPKSPPSSSQAITELVSESLALREPSASLSVRNHKSSNPSRIISNTITIRSPLESVTFEHRPSPDESQESFKSLLTKDRTISESISENLVETVAPKSSSDGKLGSSLGLEEPSVSLVKGKEPRRDDVKSQMKNITLRPAPNSNVNEIHLKFEAEVHLLNDFNESFKQFMAAEKAFEHLKSRNNETNLAMSKMLQNVETQTSFMTRSLTERSSRDALINFSRGSDVIEELDESIVNGHNRQNSTLSTDWNLSNLNESSRTTVSTGEEGRSRFSVASIENYSVNSCAANCLLSLNIFDHLIKDEDARIQQLKSIIKIREQALLDRTKCELLCLDIQKKELLETGKIEEASLLKKKQRGIILKREQERNEIKKLKQMQKEVSEQRKNTLKQHRNLIKTQLSTDKMLSKITVKKRKERRSTGPLRVVQSCSESIHSETSISLKSSGIEEVLSVTSRSIRQSEESEMDFSRKSKDEDAPVSSAKRTLLMREAALQKRRKAAEELLRWHRKLLEEERKIGELEAAATSVVRRPQEERKDKHRFNGRQLNQLWRNMTGCEERRFVEDKHYVMSQVALERLCKSARQYSNKSRKTPTTTRNSEQSDGNSEKSARRSSDDLNYSSVFEPESVQEIINSQEEKTKISSISELIDNFSRIEDEISILSRKSGEIASLREETMTPSHVEEVPTVETSEESEKTVPEINSVKEVEPSVIQVTEKDEDTSTPHEDIEEEEIPVAFDPEFVSNETPKSAPELSEITTETQELVESIPEASFSPENTTESRRECSKQTTPIPEDSTSLEAHESATGHTEYFKKDSIDEQISVDTEERTEPAEASSEHDSVRDTEGSSERSTSSTEDQNEFIPTVKDLGEVSEEISSKVKTVDESPSVEDQEERVQKTVDESSTISTEYQDQKSVLTENRAEAIVESPSRDIDVGRELLSLDEALESASKIEESLSKLNEKLVSDRRDETSEDVSSTKGVESIEEETPPESTSKSDSSSSDEKTPLKKTTSQIDVKKRVSEILADVSPSRGDKSPRLQDLYITAYDVGATNPPELSESVGEDGRQLPTDIFGIEAEELWRKQLAIEQEIKQIELQQKEQVPFVFMREIPNKPPPPYTPPSSHPSLPRSILPTDAKELGEVASYSSKVLYKAYQNRNLDKVKFSEQGFKLFSKVDVARICAEYIFHICRDLAKEHYRQFETVEEPSWLVLPKRPQLTRTKPSDAAGLERILVQKLKELFGFKKIQVAESAIVKWGRKKRDHVDEVLVIESQEEESQWINFDKDELIVKNQVTDDVMRMLLEETAVVFSKILAKKKSVAG